MRTWWRRGSVAGALAVALCAAHTVVGEPIQTEAIVTYDITGKTVPELLQSIARNGPRLDQPGRHSVARAVPKFSWNWNLAASPAGCRIVEARVALAVTMHMPRWQDRDLAPAALQAEWDRYYADVLEHERRHAAISRRTAQAIERTIRSLPVKPTCLELRATIRPAVEAVVRQHDAEQAALDVKEGSCLLRKSCLGEAAPKR